MARDAHLPGNLGLTPLRDIWPSTWDTVSAALPVSKMAPEAPRLPDDLKNDTRDVSDLWKDALKAYKGIVGFDLEKRFDSVQAMVDQGTKEMNNFHKFRHNEKKVDKLRTLFTTNLEYIEQGAQQLIAAAVPAFPPAAAIGTAITYMLGACRQVSADYDIVVVFFEDMNSFLQRIVILETRMPKYKAYQNCLMEVFTSFLTMCGFAHKYIELGRFKKWITNLLQGEDSDLSDARKAMDTQLSRLQSATEFAILGNTEELQRMSLELKTNQQSHTAMLEEQMEVMGSIRDTTETIASDMAKLLKAFDEHKKDRSGEKVKHAVADQSKPPSAKRIRNVLPEVEGDEHEYRVLKDTIVEDTCKWVFGQPQWDEWMASDKSLLAITGHSGSGKSHIGATVYDRLAEEAAKDSSKHTCAAHFYFREQTESLSGFIYALITTINQVVEQSAPICDLVNTEWLKDEVDINVWEWEDLARKLLAPAFRKSSKNRLYLMLDGIDELKDPDTLVEFLKIVKEEELRISVVVTSRPHALAQLSEVASILNIEVDKTKQIQDLKELVWNRLNTLSELRTFSRYVKQRVADKVEEAAPNMLYAEHMLFRFNALGREGAVLRNLDKPLPADLHDLYESLAEECYRRTGSNHQGLVNKLLHWAAYSFRPMSLDEVTSLIRSWADDDAFDLEEIPEPFARFVRVGDPGADAEARAKIQSQGGWKTAVNQLEKSQDTANPDAIYNDGNLPVKFYERSMRSFFRESPKKEGSLRWTSSEAHRQIFLDCAKLACPLDRDRTKVRGNLKRYMTFYLVKHWAQINVEEHSPEQQAEVMEAFASTMLNKRAYATMLEFHGADYKSQFTDEVFDKIAKWAKVEAKLGDEAAQWWTEMAQNPRNCLIHLVKAHLKRLYNAINTRNALIPFKVIRSALQLKNFPDELGDASEPLTEKQAALAIEGLFGVEIPPSGYRAVASILLSYKHHGPADVTGLKAVKTAKEPLELVKTFEIMAGIHAKKDPAKAYEYINTGIAVIDESTLGWVKRICHLNKARIELELERNDEAAESYRQARQVDTTILTPGNVLEEELAIFEEDEDMTRYVETLKKWTPLERLTWMAWQYEDYAIERHALLRDVAVETGEVEFIAKMYEESIKYLDNVNAAAPLRCDLALFHLEVGNDPETARKVLDEVLDSGSTGWPYAVTDELPETTLERAINSQTEVLYLLFGQSRDPEVKSGLLQAVEGLMARPLALDVPPNSATYFFQRRMTMARMYLKMGPSREFHTNLQGVIDSCIEALSDKVGWNDGDNLVFLAKALCILSDAIKGGDELKRAARVLVSARFNRLDPDVKDDDGDSEDESEESDSGSESDEEEAPTDEGDLLPRDNCWATCHGACKPLAEYAWWGDRVAYQCLTCLDGFLCEECHGKRLSMNRGEDHKTRRFCGDKHEYLKVPIEGWKGVQDGKVRLEGEEDIGFGELLRKIRDELCKEAWDAFWLG
ncbi:hypothetical protein ACJZ2D_004461 [Fusarium nematophilum]